MAEQALDSEISTSKSTLRAESAAFILTAATPLALIVVAVVCALTRQPTAAWITGALGALGSVPSIVVSVRDSFNRKPRDSPERSKPA